MPGMLVRFAGETDVGMKRSHNEDALFLPDSERLVLVADGMGGHASGDVASRTALETITSFFQTTASVPEITWPFMVDREGRQNENRMITSIKLANLKIFDDAQKNPKLRGMGTTVVGCLFTGKEVLVAHVGDSRVYRIRNNKLMQITEDHSLLNDYIKMGRISPDEVDRFPHKNVIVRALGMKQNVAVDLLSKQPRIGDLYILCSDGLTDMVEDAHIREIVLSEENLDRCCERLVKLANENGGKDNITVVMARLEARV